MCVQTKSLLGTFPNFVISTFYFGSSGMRYGIPIAIHCRLERRSSRLALRGEPRHKSFPRLCHHVCARSLPLSFFLFFHSASPLRTLPTTVPSAARARSARADSAFRSQSVVLGMPRAMVVRAQHSSSSSSSWRRREKSIAICINVLLSLLGRGEKKNGRDFPPVSRRAETSIFLPRDARAPCTACIRAQRALTRHQANPRRREVLQTSDNFLPNFVATLAFSLQSSERGSHPHFCIRDTFPLPKLTYVFVANTKRNFEILRIAGKKKEKKETRGRK